MNRCWLIPVLAMLGGAHVAADELRRNPFNHPEFETEAPRSVDRPGVAADPLVVSAILAAGDASLVNVDGSIIGIGDEVSGHVLESVGEETAVFRRGGEIVTVSVFEQAEDNDD